jgi:hypothetical protein
MRYATPRLRRAATRLFDYEAGGGQATAEDLAAAFGRLIEKLSQRLAQIIGPGGVEAILQRAITMRRAEFPFLEQPRVSGWTSAGLAEDLRARLQELEPAVIREASIILVATFAGILAIIIGDGLAWRLLREVWPDTLLLEIEPVEADE